MRIDWRVFVASLLLAGCANAEIPDTTTPESPLPAEVNVLEAAAGHLWQEKAYFIRSASGVERVDERTIDAWGPEWDGGDGYDDYRLGIFFLQPDGRMDRYTWYVGDGGPYEPKMLVDRPAYDYTYDDVRKTFRLAAVTAETAAKGWVAGELLTVQLLAEDRIELTSPVRPCTLEDWAAFTDVSDVVGVRSVWQRCDDLSAFIPAPEGE